MQNLLKKAELAEDPFAFYIYIYSYYDYYYYYYDYPFAVVEWLPTYCTALHVDGT